MKPSPSMIVALLALFIALAGGAYALVVPKNSVKSKQIKNGQVKRTDLGANAVDATKVADGSLNGAEIADGSLNGAEIADSGLTGAEIADASLTGADIDQATLRGADGKMSSNPASCNDDDEDGEDCGSVVVTLERTSDVLLLATAGWLTASFDDLAGPSSGSDSVNNAEGSCILTVDGTPLSGMVATTLLEAQASVGAAPTGEEPITLSGVQEGVAAGPHSFALRCTEVDGDIDWFDINVSVVVLDG
jgi:hypothetical protein